MKTTFAFCVLVALLLAIATTPATAGKAGAGTSAAHPAQKTPASQPAPAPALASLEQKLIGTWFCGPCVGDYTFKADGTYTLENYTPGNHTLTGTWTVRWDSLPPSLVLMCKTSDFKRGAPTLPEYEYLGKALELKLLELNRDTFVLKLPKDKKAEFPNDTGERRYERRPAKDGAEASSKTPAHKVPATQPAGQGGAARGGELAGLERKLLGPWKGAACAGDYTFKADGTYECRMFTPGQNTMTGTWSIRWDALPPTLVLICKTSDFRTKTPTREEYELLGKPLELKLVELNGDAFVYRYANDKFDWHSQRAGK